VLAQRGPFHRGKFLATTPFVAPPAAPGATLTSKSLSDSDKATVVRVGPPTAEKPRARRGRPKKS
jgi:hypothetical protein